MQRYIALLRGVNISGKNKIPMQGLKSYIEELGFSDVCTYLNSGNVVFSADESGEYLYGEKTEAMIQEKFALSIPVLVISQDRLKEALESAPQWWGTGAKDVYDNLIFVMPHTTADVIVEKIGKPTEGLEQIQVCGDMIFWSFDRKRYAKCDWWKKTASAGIGEMLTIRTANTVKKIAEM